MILKKSDRWRCYRCHKNSVSSYGMTCIDCKSGEKERIARDEAIMNNWRKELEAENKVDNIFKEIGVARLR